MRALSTSTLSTQKSTSNHWGVLFSQITSLDTALQCFSYFLLKVEFFAPLLHLYSYIPISIKLYLCNSVIVLCWTWKGRQTTATTKLYCSSFLLTKITVFSVFTSFHAQLANQNQTAVEQNQYLMPTFSFQWFAGENTSGSQCYSWPFILFEPSCSSTSLHRTQICNYKQQSISLKCSSYEQQQRFTCWIITPAPVSCKHNA